MVCACLPECLYVCVIMVFCGVECANCGVVVVVRSGYYGRVCGWSTWSFYVFLYVTNRSSCVPRRY